MVRRVGFMLVLVVALLGVASGALAQTTTSSPATTTPTTVAPTTAPPTTVARTTTVPRSTTTSSSSTSTSTTSTTVPADNGGSSISGKTIALIVAALALLVLIGVLIYLLLRQRDARRWAEEAAQAAAEGRAVLALATQGIATLDQPAAAAHTWGDLEAQGAQLHQRLDALSRRPPEPWLGTAVAKTDQSLSALRSATDADRALRLGPPPPTAEQLGYSEAVIRERAAEFDHELGGLDAALARRGR